MDKEQNVLLGRRLAAGLVDLVIALLFVKFIPVAGLPLGLAFILLKDKLPIPQLKGRSPGKALFSLRLQGDDAGELTAKQAIVRNLQPAMIVVSSCWIYITGIVVSVLKVIGGDVLAVSGAALFITAFPFLVVATAVMIVGEIGMMVRDPAGKRAGDRFARSHVTLGKP